MKPIQQGRKANSWFESIGVCISASVVVALQARMAYDLLSGRTEQFDIMDGLLLY